MPLMVRGIEWGGFGGTRVESRMAVFASVQTGMGKGNNLAVRYTGCRQCASQRAATVTALWCERQGAMAGHSPDVASVMFTREGVRSS
ncbi:hypothetical protein D3C71_1883340 [compost metagenome]